MGSRVAKRKAPGKSTAPIAALNLWYEPAASNKINERKLTVGEEVSFLV
jgi:hypothetical protein